MKPGTVLGQYRIVSELGVGGMGEVYRAHDTQLNRDVALKVLPEVFAHDAERVARFTREAQTLAALDHPNIAQIHGIVEAAESGSGGHGAPHVHALVMELVEGDDLSALIGRGPIPVADAVLIARQIADALEAAHERDVIHRDLKPANIKIRPDGTVKVLDFGLAKALASPSDVAAGFSPMSPQAANSPTMVSPTLMSPAKTAMGMLIGTAAYMSPEQAKGKTVDRRADIWAFGAVVYEMLTGRRAFEGDDIAEVLAAVLKTEPDWAAVPSSTPPSVRRLMHRCLEKDVRKRLSAIGDARLDLDERDDAPQPTVPALPARARWKSWAWLSVGALAFVAITAFVVARAVRPSDPTAPKRLSIVAPPGAAIFADSRQSAVSPDGRHVAFITGSSSSNEATQLWVRPFDAVDARRIQGVDGAQLPFWSPDGRRLGFFANGKLSTVPVDGGPVKELCAASDGRGATWGANGVIVFAPTAMGPLYRISADGGDPSVVTTLDASRKEKGHRFPFFLPDGRHFMFAAMPGHNGLFNIFIGSIDGADRPLALEAESTPVYTEPGYLLFARKGSLVAQGFDAKSMRISGDPIALDDEPGDVGFWFTAGSAASAASSSLVYLRDPFVNSRLVWVDRAGRELGSVDAAPGRYIDLRLAPDGQHVAVVRAASAQQASIWVHDLERRSATRIAESQHINYFPVWSPDGKRITYASDDSGTETLFSRDASGATPATLFYSAPALFKKPQCWTPDGRFVLFTQISPETQNDIMAVSTSGQRAVTPYLNEPFNENGAKISPDGKWVAYLSDEAGRNDVYVKSFPAPDRKYRVTTDGGTWVAWKRDGTALLIVGADGRQLKLADVRPGNELSFSVPKVVGALPADPVAWDATGDLQRLLVSVPATGAPGISLTVVVDWLSALKKKG